jgi:hypothetical protein
VTRVEPRVCTTSRTKGHNHHKKGHDRRGTEQESIIYTYTAHYPCCEHTLLCTYSTQSTLTYPTLCLRGPKALQAPPKPPTISSSPHSGLECENLTVTYFTSEPSNPSEPSTFPNAAHLQLTLQCHHNATCNYLILKAHYSLPSKLQLKITTRVKDALLQPLAFQEAHFETSVLGPFQDAITSPT